MATLLITELSDMVGDDKSRSVPVAKLPPVAEQSVSYTTSTQSSALNGATRFVRVIADADAYIAVGENPTATATSVRVLADTAEYFGVDSTDAAQKIAVYDGSS